MKIVISYIVYFISISMFITQVKLTATEWLLFGTVMVSLGLYALWIGESLNKTKKESK